MRNGNGNTNGKAIEIRVRILTMPMGRLMTVVMLSAAMFFLPFKEEIRCSSK